MALGDESSGGTAGRVMASEEDAAHIRSANTRPVTEGLQDLLLPVPAALPVALRLPGPPGLGLYVTSYAIKVYRGTRFWSKISFHVWKALLARWNRGGPKRTTWSVTFEAIIEFIRAGGATVVHPLPPGLQLTTPVALDPVTGEPRPTAEQAAVLARADRYVMKNLTSFRKLFGDFQLFVPPTVGIYRERIALEPSLVRFMVDGAATFEAVSADGTMRTGMTLERELRRDMYAEWVVHDKARDTKNVILYIHG